MSWYVSVLRNYAQFGGRARRREYWMFTLITTVIMLAAALAGLGLFAAAKPLGIVVFVLDIAYALATVVPTLAVAIRRLHDSGLSGWWYLVGFVPYVGGIVLLVLCCLDSADDNKYGPNPKRQQPPRVPDLPWPQAPFGQ